MLSGAGDDAGAPPLRPPRDGGGDEGDAGQLAIAGDGDEARAEALSGAVKGDVDGAGAAPEFLGDAPAGMAVGPERERGLMAGVQVAECGAHERVVKALEHRLDNDVA